MCLILFGVALPSESASLELPSDLRLLVAANRDEFHGRASAAADFWTDSPHILAGRDLEAGGTWLGCTRTGRFAALTNFSHPDDPPAKYSRGTLVQEFLTGSDTAAHYAHHISGVDYAGFNLLLFDGDDMVYTSNKATTDILHSGFYGLSNAELGAEWPKCVQGASALKRAATRSEKIEPAALLSLLENRAVPPDEELPHRGRPLELERRVAPRFIVGDEYGTRASTVVALFDDRVEFVEQSFVSGGHATGRVSFEFEVEGGH